MPPPNNEKINLENAVLIDNFLSLGYQEIRNLTKAKTAIALVTKLLEKQQLNADLVAKVLNTQANLNLKK